MPLLIADVSFGELLLIALEVFFFVIWIWILITILTDLFRDHEVSGVMKAVWVFFLVFLPFITALIYLIVRGQGMRQRALNAQAEARAAFDDYVRDTASGAPVEELHRLHELKEKGGITDAEYEQMKAKLLAGQQAAQA